MKVEVETLDSGRMEFAVAYFSLESVVRILVQTATFFFPHLREFEFSLRARLGGMDVKTH